MAIDEVDAGPEAYAALGLESVKIAVEGFQRQLAGCRETNAALAGDNANLRGRASEAENLYSLALDRNRRLEARVEELERHIEATASARVERHLSGAGETLAALDAEQKGMLWAALSYQMEIMASGYRSGVLAPRYSYINRFAAVRDILFPGGKPESGGENLAGG